MIWEGNAGEKRPEPGRNFPYDPAFRKAVIEGHLSVEEAAERGNRHRYATRLAERHGLPLVLALMVADNRASIGDAKRLFRRSRKLSPAPGPAAASDRTPTGLPSRFLVIAAGIVLGCVAALGTATDRGPSGRADSGDVARRPSEAPRTDRPIRLADSPEPTTGIRRAKVMIRQDDEGRVTRITARDPGSVLVAFCEAGFPDDPRKPYGMAPALPPSTGVRMGIFWSSAREGEPLQAIRIRKEGQSRRWSAGDGRHPIPFDRAPEYPDDVEVRPAW